MTVLHAFTQTAADSTVSGIVHPADWIADHEIDAGTQLLGMVPIGAVVPWAGLIASLPTDKFLFCNGQSLLRAGTYAGLYAIIGTMYGAVDGTHFNVPNLVDYFVVGANADSGGVPKSTITGAAAQSYTQPPVTLTHSMTIADHTLTHAGFSVGNHPALTHAALSLADHAQITPTISVGAQATVTNIKTTTVTKTASKATVASASAHAWTDPVRAAQTHNVTSSIPDHAIQTHAVTQPNAHTGAAVTHGFTPPSDHAVSDTDTTPAFLALAYMIRYA
jgi:hypothetical protein